MDITCIMPVKDNEKIIEVALRSLLAGLWECGRTYELLIVDDSRHGRTGDKAKEIAYKREFDIMGGVEYHHVPQCTIGAKYNYGVAHSTGEYIFQCDSDDVYPIDKFKIQCKALDDGFDLSCTNLGARWIDLRDPEKRVFEIVKNHHPMKTNQGGTAAYTRTVFERMGGLEDITKGSDCALGDALLKLDDVKASYITDKSYLNHHFGVDGHGGNLWKSKEYRWDKYNGYFKQVPSVRWDELIAPEYLKVFEEILDENG